MSNYAGIDVSADGQIVTIDGQRFHRSLFKHLATGAVGKSFRILTRGEFGVVSLELLPGPHQAPRQP